jgi:prepilin-type N-terminal cleavage/methylation domain-containing protein/prepilin-type processing-associated H-X9-DG protein
MSRPTPRPAFSLVELLIVIAIIAVLLALLLPVLARARRAARATACLASLHQWGQAYRLYANANRGKDLVMAPVSGRPDDGTPPFWWELLQPHRAGGDVAQALLCPDATEPANAVPKNAFQAWGPDYFWDGPGGKVRGPFVGSYAFNGWLMYPPTDPPSSGRSATTPLIADGATLAVWPRDADPPASFDANASTILSMRGVALQRHANGLHIVFLDGHASPTTLPELWTLTWSRSFVARTVTIQR